MNIQTLSNQITEESTTADFNLTIWAVEYYNEDYNDWQTLDEYILDENESIQEEVIKQMNKLSQHPRYFNQTLKVRIFDREYAELYLEDDEVMIGDLSSGCGCSDYYYQNGVLESTEDFTDF